RTPTWARRRSTRLRAQASPEAPTALLLGNLEVLVVDRGGPVAAPLEARPRERAHHDVTVDDHAGPDVVPIQILPARLGQHQVSADVRVLDRVDVDRLAVGMNRELATAGLLPAVERRAVVGLHGRIVVPAVVLDALHPADRELVVVEVPEDLHHVLGDIL